MKYIVDIKGEIEGDYEIIGKYEERPQDEATEEAIKGIDEILEENDIMGDVYLTERMMNALKFAQEALKKMTQNENCSMWNIPPSEERMDEKPMDR